MKKYFFVIIALGLFSFVLQAPPAHAATPAFVQSASSSAEYNYGNLPIVSAQFASGTTAGDTIVVSLEDGSGNNNVTGCKDTADGSTPYSEAAYAYDSTAGQEQSVWYATNIASGTTPTVTCTFFTPTSFVSIFISEYTNLNTLDVASSVVKTSNSTALKTATSTTHFNGDLIYASFLGTNGKWTSFTNGTGFTTRVNNAVAAGMASEDEVQATAGAVSATATSGSSRHQADVIAAFSVSTTTTPSISNITSTPGINTAAITWTTGVGADSLVNYGTSTSYSASSTYSRFYVTAHSITLSGLSTSTTYHYQVVSSDGSAATSSDHTFTTGPGLVTGPGNFLVADSLNKRVEEFSSAGTYEGQIGCATGACSTGSGNGQFGDNGSDYIQDIAVDASGNIWVVDQDNDRVEEFSANGTYESQFGSSGIGNGEFTYPWGIAIDASGNIWVADEDNDRVQEFSANGTYESQFDDGGGFNQPQGIAIDASGNIWIPEAGNYRVDEFSATGTYENEFGSYGAGNGYFNDPDGVAIDASDNIWVADSNNNRVEEFSATGTYEGQASSTTGGNFLANPQTPVIDSNGNLWVTNNDNGSIDEFSATGTYENQFASNGTGNGYLSGPEGIVITNGGSSNGTTGGTGTLDSQTFDTGVTSGAQLNSVMWQGTEPASTTASFQIAVSNSSSGPWTFTGPDGTSATSYTAIPLIPATLTNYPTLKGRYFRYQIILTTNANGTATPLVTGVVVNWSP